MRTQTIEAQEQDEVARLWAWRAEVLLQGAWADNGVPVWSLAEDLTIDYRRAIELRERGCPASLALEILT